VPGVTERVIVMDADAASRRAAELAAEAAAARQVEPAPATGFLAIDLGASRLAACATASPRPPARCGRRSPSSWAA
jgi:hypothetical protein